MDECKVIQVIKTTLLRRGDGTVDNPIRIIDQYWSLDGKLLWEYDPCKEQPMQRTIEA